jgi:hypothetical protein
MGMSTTDTIRGMGIVVRRRRVATGRSTTSRGMRLGMGRGILGMPGIARLGNIALGLSVAVVADVGAAAAGTR